MTQQEILEGSKLCAEFLDLILWTGFGSKKNQYVKKIPNEKTEVFENVLFHSDWNWLMKIVDKIEELDYTTKIIDNGMCINGKVVIERWGKSKKEGVFITCLEFIKWYNENNK